MTTALSSFALFPYLPAELRLQIWRESCTPRVVEVVYSEQDDRCRTTTKPPALLQVCCESRGEGLREYRKLFGTRTRQASIYFSPIQDILYLPRCGAMGYGDTTRDFAHHVTDAAQYVHSLAIDHVHPKIRRPWETYNKLCLIRSFSKLADSYLIFASETRDAATTRQQPGQIDFLDPQSEDKHIMELMDAVSESFSYEAGYDITARDIPKNESNDDCNPCDETTGLAPIPPLIPKTKAV